MPGLPGGLYRADLAPARDLRPAAAWALPPRPAPRLPSASGAEASVLVRAEAAPSGPLGATTSPVAGSPVLPQRRLLFVARSGSERDDNGFALALSGADLSSYTRNPVVLLAHDPLMPVGTAEAFLRAGRLMAWVELRPDASPVAAHVAALVEAGLLRGLSVGARLVRSSVSDDGRTLQVSRWRLAELSLTTLPADRGALRIG